MSRGRAGGRGRSRLFWLGVPGLLLLLVAWWDSGGHESMVHIARGNSDHRVRLQFGSIWWERTSEWRPEGVNLEHFSTERSSLRSERAAGFRGRRFDLPPALYRYETSFGGSSFKKDISILQVGLWVIVAVYVMMWEVMVFAWQLRKARVALREVC